MATRTLEIDLRQGTGASSEPMYGIVTVQRVKAKSTGGFVVLPFETSLKLVDGKATITQAVTDGTGPMYDSAYLFRVQNGYCGQRYGFMAALPDGTTPITTGEMPMVDPITGEGIYMDAQEWNDLYGDLPNRVSATESRLTLLDGQGQRGYIVKQQAGRTVSVWDYLNNREQLIYGNTGERDISSLLVNANGVARLQRTGDTVHLYLQSVVPTAAGSGVFLNLPSGFRPSTQRSFQLNVASAGSTYRSAYMFTSGGVGAWLQSTSDIYSFTYSFPTANPWPTTLPGTSVGSIPA